MKLSIQLTADDYIRARHLAMRPRPVLRYVGWFLLGLFILVQKTLQAPAELELTESDFVASSSHGTFKMAWGEFHKWKKNERLILIYQSSALMHMIPVRAFGSSEDILQLEAILEKHLGAQKA